MIYQIYIKYHDDKFSRSLHAQNDEPQKTDKPTFRSRSRELLPFHVPPEHYDNKKVTASLHALNLHVQQSKEVNKYLATRILFSHGKAQTRKFLHRSKQLFGNKLQGLKKKKMTSSDPQTNRKTSYEPTQPQNSCSQFVKNQQLYFETYRPDFTIRTKRQPPEIRQTRRQVLGLEEADLKNYEEKRRGLTATNKRKQKKKQTKDFKKMNMNGLAAKITANLELRQEVNTKTLARLLNLKILQEATQKKIAA